MGGDIEAWRNMLEKAVKDDAAIARHGEHETTGAGDARTRTIDKANAQHQADNGSRSSTLCGAEQHSYNGHVAGGR